MSAVVCPSGIKPVLRLGAHLGCVTRTMLGAVVHLTGFAECSAKHCFLFLNLWMNEHHQIGNCSCDYLKFGIRNAVLSLYEEFLVIFRGAGACQVQILTGHVCVCRMLFHQSWSMFCRTQRTLCFKNYFLWQKRTKITPKPRTEQLLLLWCPSSRYILFRFLL